MYPTQNLHINHGQCVLLLIDPQNDFHDGSLTVPGACAQAVRIAKMIRDNTVNNKLGEIFVTLDSHHKKHIAHKSFWIDKDGNEPPDYTIITEQSLRDGVWSPKDCSLKSYCLRYTRHLESKVDTGRGRFKLTIWPDHCLIGSDGHAIQEDIQSAIRVWDTHHFTKSVKYIHKGMNCLTEMYSAIVAEVPVPTDHTTTENTELLDGLFESGRLLVCGQALSHCVNLTVRDIVAHWKKKGRKLSDIYILVDGSAPVLKCEGVAQQFLDDMQREGLTLTTIDTAFDDWDVPVTNASSAGNVVSAEGQNGDFGKLQGDAVTMY